MKGTIRNSTWDIYKVDKKKEVLMKTIDKLIVEIDGSIVKKNEIERNIALSFFGKDSVVFKSNRYKIKLVKINFLLDHGKTNYHIEDWK